MRILLITILFIGAHMSHGQNIHLDVGVGAGNVLIKRQFERNKTLVYFHLHHDLSEKFNVGIYYNAGGDFLVPFGDASIELGDTTLLLPESMGFNSLFATSSYFITNKLKASIMFGMLTHRQFIHADELDKLKNNSIGYGLLLEYMIKEKFPIALSFQSGGKSPDFNGMQDGRSIIMEGKRLPMLYLTVGYQFTLMKSKTGAN